MPFPLGYQYNERVLGLSKVGASTLGPSMESTLSLSVDQDDILRTLRYKLEAYVLTDHVTKQNFTLEFSVEVPTTWFQHLKQDRMRTWILRRWPVRTRTISKTESVTYQKDHLYPEASLELPPSEFGKPTIVSWWSR